VRSAVKAETSSAASRTDCWPGDPTVHTFDDLMTTFSAPRNRATLSIVLGLALVAGTSPLAAQASPAVKAQHDSIFVAKARADSARLPYVEADVFFMQGMISHHAQAIVMAKWAPTHGASDAVQTLCARIINAQTDEIALMQTWLRDRHQRVPAAVPAPMPMKMNGMVMDMMMPGMLTDDQMKRLDAARGTEFDRLFLVFMIQHHSGAVSMVKDLFDTPGAGQDELTFKFASDVNVDQTTEIARMQKMLANVVTGVRNP
jgi:uncharacterized protein (DUF305 family)